VADAKVYVERNLTVPLHTAQASQHVGLCEPHFCHVFKKATGLTFSDYLAHRRIEKAKQLLKTEPSQRVREVALATGFQTVSHFNHVFRRLVRSSPTVWRSRQHREPVP
jgi:AraC-like DNA-binding protein